MNWQTEIGSKMKRIYDGIIAWQATKLKTVDDVWYVAESWHKRVYNPGDGSILLSWFWDTVVLLPRIVPFLFRSLSWV